MLRTFQMTLVFSGHRLKFPKNTTILSLKFNFIYANSADPDEMLSYAVFHFGLLYLL